jgi:hypothetical protein
VKDRLARWWVYFKLGFAVVGMLLSCATFIIVGERPVTSLLSKFLPPEFTTPAAWVTMSSIVIVVGCIGIGYFLFKFSRAFQIEAVMGTMRNKYNTDLLVPVLIPLFEAQVHLARFSGDIELVDKLDALVKRSKEAIKK